MNKVPAACYFLILLGATFLLINICKARDLGVHGTVFKITENNLLHVIEQRLQKLKNTGQIEDAQQKIAKRIQAQMQSPQPNETIRHTSQPRQFLWDPTLIVEENIKDHQGNIIIHKGTRVNPLDHVSWGKPILLIDGEAKDQIEYANGFKDQKLILIKGKPIEFEQQLQRPIYFDQGGLIIKKFGIKQVPCRISQQGKHLLVEEIELKQARRKNEQRE
jgi:conjugal transfer pilus assembly protein TraW